MQMQPRVFSSSSENVISDEPKGDVLIVSISSSTVALPLVPKVRSIMLIVWFFKLIANLPQLLLCEDPTPDDPVVMLAPHALVVDELVTLAVGQQFLEALHVKKRLASAPRQFHKVIQVDGDKRLIGRMVQAPGPFQPLK